VKDSSPRIVVECNVCFVVERGSRKAEEARSKWQTRDIGQGTLKIGGPPQNWGGGSNWVEPLICFMYPICRRNKWSKSSTLVTVRRQLFENPSKLFNNVARKLSPSRSDTTNRRFQPLISPTKSAPQTRKLTFLTVYSWKVWACFNPQFLYTTTVIAGLFING
jgi:hypothetical protein